MQQKTFNLELDALSVDTFVVQPEPETETVLAAAVIGRAETGCISPCEPQQISF